MVGYGLVVGAADGDKLPVKSPIGGDGLKIVKARPVPLVYL